MIIHLPEIKTDKNHVTITTRFEMDTNIEGMQESFWYRYPIRYAPYIEVDRNDGSVVALDLLAMKYGEDIKVKGIVSPKLAYQLQEFQLVYEMNAKGENLRPIKITYEKLIPMGKTDVAKTVGTFSGGLDSSYMVWSQLPQNDPDQLAKISDMFFIHGFDTYLEETTHYHNALTKFTPALKELGINLISVSTNIFYLYEFRIDWLYANNPALIATSLFLGNHYDKIFQGGDSDFIKGNYLCSFLLSTESTQIIHQGNTKNRFQKLIEMKDWSFLHRNLRLCVNHQKTDEVVACYNCVKCLGTATMLRLFGLENIFDYFPKKYSTKMIIRSWAVNQNFNLLISPARMRITKLALYSKNYSIAILINILVLLSVPKDFIVGLAIKKYGKEKNFKVKEKLFPNP